jgi:hypothetical protein
MKVRAAGDLAVGKYPSVRGGAAMINIGVRCY